MATGMTQGRRLIVNALEAAVPRLRPRQWISDERLLVARIPAQVIAPFPHRLNLGLRQVPSRLYWQVKARTPSWEAQAYHRRQQRDQRRRALQQQQSALPPLEVSFSPRVAAR